MTAPVSAEVGPDRTAADLKRWFPGTVAWLGHATGSWWALARDRAGECHLVEAATPAELVRRLDRLDVPRAVPSATPPGDMVLRPRYSRARLDATLPDLPPVFPTPAPRGRVSGERRHRAPRRGLVRAALGGLIAP
ncbi:hypothetical protein AB0L25_01340 [Spirillospora sp. NPDC052242]